MKYNFPQAENILTAINYQSSSEEQKNKYTLWQGLIEMQFAQIQKRNAYKFKPGYFNKMSKINLPNIPLLVFS